MVRKLVKKPAVDLRLALPRLDVFESCRPGRRTNDTCCSGHRASFLSEPFFSPCKHGEHAASEPCRKARRSRCVVHHGKANLRNKQGGETFASNLCTEVQRVGRGKSYRSTAGSAYPLGYEFAPRGCGQRLPNVVPSGADCPRRHWPQLDNCIFSSIELRFYYYLDALDGARAVSTSPPMF